MTRRPLISPLFPYTTLFRSSSGHGGRRKPPWAFTEHGAIMAANDLNSPRAVEMSIYVIRARSEEHTSELQSRENLVCRLLLEKKKFSLRRHQWMRGRDCQID